MKKIYPGICFFGFFLLLLCFPQQSFTYSKAGLLLWFQTLLPSLLPFMIVTNILIETQVLNKIIGYPRKLWKYLFGISPNGVYALITGLFCGFPMGAKVSANLYRNGQISKAEAGYLMALTNCASPMFISSFVVVETLHAPGLLKQTFLIFYGCIFLCSLFLRRIYGVKEESIKLHDKKEVPAISQIGIILDNSIMDAFESITRLGGYVILFSIISGFLQNFLHGNSFPEYLLLGITEISTGITVMASAPYSLGLRYISIIAFLAFGGICTAAQTKSMLKGTDLSIRSYLLSKLFTTAVCVVLAILVI